MKIDHKKASGLIVNKWTGGTTTELDIYPRGSSYAERNFLFRISTATVESEESIFTKLPGVSRKLMILDGKIKIVHEGHHSITLNAFEQDEFKGDWNTKSYGKATDFNLMMKGSTSGIIKSLTFKDNESRSIATNSDYLAIYIFEGQVDLKIDNKSIISSKGDFISVINQKSETNIKINTTALSKIILTEIHLQ